MALEDVFGDGDMSGTAQLAQQLFEASQPDDGQPTSSDPVELTQRLSRKLAITPSKVGGVDFDKAIEKPKKPEAEKSPDLSSFGEPVSEPSNDDLSSFGEEVKPPQPKPGVLATVGAQAGAFGKGLVRGAPEAVGSMMQGGAALTKAQPVSPEGMALVDELGTSGSMSASERAKLMGRALRGIGDRGLQMDYNAALQRIARGGDAAAEAQTIRDKFGIQNKAAAVPVEETPLYKAGTATKDWIDKTVPMTDSEKDSVGGRVGTGVSSMLPYLAAGVLVGPQAGLVLGAAGMGAQTAGDTFQAAKAKGATDEQAVTAAGWGAGVGATLGALPLGVVFKPVSAASPGMKAWLAAKLVQAGQSGVTFATVGEAQEYLLQEIAKEQYDPKAGYSPDAKRVISSLLTGGALGVMHPLAPKPSDLSSPDTIADFLKKAAKASGSMSPEEERGAQTRSEIDDFIREKDAREAAAAPGLPGPEAPAPEAPIVGEPEPKPSPSGGEAVPPTEQTETEGLKRYGWSAEEIAAMTPAQRREEFQSAMETGKSEAPKQPDNNPVKTDTFTTAKGSTYEVHEDGTTTRTKAARPEHPGDEGLKDRSAKTVYIAPDKIDAFAIPQDSRWRVVDHGDGTMSLATWNEKQKRWGISPSSRNVPVSTEPTVGSHPLELWKPEKVNGRPAFKGMHPGNKITAIGAPVNPVPGSRAAPIRPETGADVFHAQAAEPSPAQAEAENFKHSHMELAHLGLTGRNSISIETGAGQVRKGPAGEDGQPAWEVTMPVPYGRIKGTKGADGEPLDIFVGPDPKSPHVFVVDQHHNDGGFDEHKIMAGFNTPQEALTTFGVAYDDLGGNRIGHVTAMTPDQFKEWISGDTTQPLKKTLSEEEIGNLFDEIVPQKGGEPSKPSANGELQGMGSPQVPREPSDGGRSPTRTGAVSEESGKSEPREGEIIAPGKVYAEPSEEHHAQIEAALGADYNHVLPVDVARAAEILAEKPGITPQLAFQYAVIENAAAQNFLTVQQLEQAYGPEVKTLLEPRSEGTSISGGSVEQGGTTIEQEPTSGGKEGGVVPRGGKISVGDRTQGATVENGEQHDAGREKPNPKRAARDRATKESPGRAEDADQSSGEVADTKITGVVYHGSTNKDFKEFGPVQSTMRGPNGDHPGIYFTSDRRAAAGYAKGGKIVAANLDIKNPLDTTKLIAKYQKEGLSFGAAKRKALTHLTPENDGITFRGDKVNPSEYVAFKPEQVRLADDKREAGSLADAFAAQLKGDGFPNILAARRLATDHGVTDVKSVEEILELATVKAAREIVETSKDPYSDLVKLYGKQPKLSTRTSTSIRDQAYSTPVPLGYLAQKLAGITKETTVYEPTAGNGALLTAAAADTKKVLANEINPNRSANLKSQGFLNTEWDASTRLPKPERNRFDRVIANPPFGPVRENDESKVFDMSDIQPGYRTTEIDHVIALRALEGMKGDGRAALIVGGINKKLTGEEARSAAYNGKAKREFYKVLYDNYNVTDHFTVAGELWERQGAGWPVDVIVINGRGKSARALPAVDVPRIYDNWEALGGLLHGQGDTEHAGAVVRPDGGAPEERSGLEGHGAADRGQPGRRGPRGGAVNGESDGVREEPVSRQPEAVNSGGNGAEEPRGSVPDRQPVRSGEQPPAERSPSRLSADEIGDIFDDLVPDETGQPEAREAYVDNAVREIAGNTQGGHKAVQAAIDRDASDAELIDTASRHGWGGTFGGRGIERGWVEGRNKTVTVSNSPFGKIELRGKSLADAIRRAFPRTRSTAEVAKSAVKNAANAADDALSGLTQLFGRGKTIGSGLNFDEDTYAKAKPLFIAAAEKFAESKHDIRTLMQRMIQHLKDAFNWTTDMLRDARPYIVKFIQDVQDGAVNLLKPEAPAETKPAKAGPVETEGQAIYQPQSKQPGLDTLVPVNMKKSIADALKGLEKRVGPIDDFVASELGYDKADLEKYFGAEQVDALGLAIDNLNDGKGFIIGDQTGIGKGRVNAAILKWAMRKGRIPIFTTEKPGLYADMFRDMTDIGMEPPRILATNAGLTMPLDDAGKVWIKTADSKKHSALMTGLTDPEKFHERYDMVFTNYSQMQTLKGETTARRGFLSTIIPNSTIVFDESHNAGGQVKERKTSGQSPDRAAFARDLVNRANGVFYSSATYAKRPDVMSLYAATDMAMAVEDIDTLGEAIAKGGIPMQQVVAAMLSKSGQYIRRERSFHGINYNTPSVDVDHGTYDEISHSLAAIQDFSIHVKEAAKAISKQLKAEAAALGHDNAVSDAGASSTTFTSKMHNIINQMLLAMKAPQAAKMAIEHIRRGEKPVLTVANTMEAFLKDYSDEIGINPGEPIEADFADVLMRYLDRSRRITMRKAFSKEKAEHHVLTDGELGSLGVQAYNDAKAMIAGMDLSHLPISPIDHIKDELTKAGYEVGEITGRGLTVDYSGDQPTLKVRPGAEITTKGRNEMRRRFNLRPEKGGLHAIIINQAGSTGISMHAGEKFDDKSKRRMMVVQPEANIDTHMQLLGRVNRTGQVVLPEYDQLVANIPAEKRPAAVLAKKMASLNANTTASRTSAVTAKDVPDFMNQYGDLVAAGYLSDNLDMNERLAWPVKPGEGKLQAEDAMRKLTGRIPLLPLKQQEELYSHLEEEYAALIKQMEASGTSPLEAKTLDLKARTLETSEVQGAKNSSGSPFAAPVNVEKVSILRQGKPFKPEELVQRLTDRLGIAKPDDPVKWISQFPREIAGGEALKIEKTERNTALKAFNDYSLPYLHKIDDAKELEAERNKLNAIKDRWTSLHTLLPIGARVRLNMVDSNPVAVVLDVKQTSETRNPLALGSWKVNFAVADATRQLTLPFSRLYLQGAADPENMLDVEVVHTNETPKDTVARFELMQSGAREERFIATGNLLSAYDWLNMKGSIINYTDTQGAVHQGILTPREFDLGKHAIFKGRVVTDPAELRTLLDQNQTVWSKDRQVNLARADRWSDNYEIQAEKKKATGGRYYLDKELTELTGDFVSRGGMMRATVPGPSLPKAIARMQQLGANFTVSAGAPKAQKVEQPPEPPEDEPPAGGGAGLASLSDASRSAESKLVGLDQPAMQALQAKLNEIVRRVAGPGFDVEFNLGLIRDNMPTVGYGDIGGMKKLGAQGMYMLDEPLIRLALAGTESDMRTGAYHESYHAIEDKLQTDTERKLMEQETPRLREWIKGKTGLNDYRVDQLAGYEVRAIAFQLYSRERDAGKSQAGSGIHIMLRRFFDRLHDLLRQIGNAFRGYGLKTYKDVFGQAFEGGLSDREHGDGAIDTSSLAARADIFHRPDTGGPLRNVMNAAVTDKIIERFQNHSEGVKRLEDAVQARMEGEIPDSKAFYQKKRLFPGKVATEIQDFNKEHLDPLVDLLKANGISLDEAGDIVYAQHAGERNAYIDTINPDMKGMGSGMSDEEAAAILDRYSAHDLAEIATKIDRIRDFVLDTMVRGGLESRSTIDGWRAQYQHYAPLGGFAEPRDDEETFRESGKFNVRGREVKQAFGRASKADNPLVNLLDQAYRTVERAKKNEYLRSLYLALAGIDPEDRKGFVQFDRGKPRREIDPLTGLVRWVDDSSYRFSPKAVAYKVGGRAHYMVFEKQETADVLKRMHPDALNGVGQALLTFQNKLKAAWTHYSPEFLIRHFLFRYPIEGTLNAFEQGNVPRYMADSIPFLGRASKAIFASTRGGVHSNPEVAQYQAYWEAQRKAGGAISFRQMRDIDMTRDHLERRLQSLTGRPIATVRDKARAFSEAMDTVTNALDNSLRLAAFAEAKRQGRTDEQAAVIARDATVDYQQAGKWKNFISLIWPFTNVAVQTGARMASATTRSRTMRAVFSASIAAGFMSAMFNYLVGGDDKDGVPFFDKMPWWQKQLHLTVLNPYHRDDKGRPVPIHVPLPYNWAFPFTIGQAMATMAFSSTRGEKRKALAAAVKAGISAFSPFAEDENIVANFAPELAKPLVHSYTNENWTGYPVHLDPAYQKGPRSESGYKTTGEGWKFTARMANAAGGGDKTHSGPLDFFPEDLREMTEYYTGLGTAFKLGLNTRNAVEAAASGQSPDYSKMPLARVVVGTDYDAADRARRQEHRREDRRPWEKQH